MFEKIRFVFLILISATCSMHAEFVLGQESKPDAVAATEAQEKAANDEGATVKGKIIADQGFPFEFDLATLAVGIAEQIAYVPPPLPSDWGTRTEEQRQTWVQEFQDSDAGKEFLAKREEQYKNQRRFQLETQKDGSFEVLNVPPGKYNLFGRKDVEVESKNYAVEVFGLIEVLDVDELDLKLLPLTVTRLLAVGEIAPAIEIDSLDKGGRLSLTQLQSRPVLVYFWTTSNPGAERDAPALKKMYEALSDELKLELVSICVDEATEKAVEFVTAQQLTWPQGRTGGWQHPLLADFGIRSIPAFCLIGADGKILFTNADFFREFAKPASDLTKIVRDNVLGIKPDVAKPDIPK